MRDTYIFFFRLFLALAALSVVVSIFSRGKKSMGSAALSLLAAVLMWSMSAL